MKRSPLSRKAPISRTGKASKAGKRKRRSPTPLSRLLYRADALARAACVAVGRCAAEGYILRGGRAYRCSERLEWSHRRSRGIKMLRHDPRNCDCLCNIHHRYFTRNQDEFREFVESVDPGARQYLDEQEQAWNNGGKRPLMEVYQRWIDHYAAIAEDKMQRNAVGLKAALSVISAERKRVAA